MYNYLMKRLVMNKIKGITYNTRPLPFLRALVVEIETFVEIKKHLCGIETLVQ